MLVHDEPLIQPMITEMLRLQRYVVLEAANGEESLRAVQEHPDEQINVLLTDMVIPQRDGKDRTYNLLKTSSHTKVLGMSGYSDDFFFHKGTPTPAVTFLQKPFMLETLAQKIRKLLDLKDQVSQQGHDPCD